MKFPADSALLSHPLPSPPAFRRTPAPSAPKAATLVLPLFYQIQHLVLLQNFLPFSHLFDTPRLWQTLGSGECSDFIKSPSFSFPSGLHKNLTNNWQDFSMFMFTQNLMRIDPCQCQQSQMLWKSRCYGSSIFHVVPEFKNGVMNLLHGIKMQDVFLPK